MSTAIILIEYIFKNGYKLNIRNDSFCTIALRLHRCMDSEYLCLHVREMKKWKQVGYYYLMLIS